MIEKKVFYASFDAFVIMEAADGHRLPEPVLRSYVETVCGHSCVHAWLFFSSNFVLYL